MNMPRVDYLRERLADPKTRTQAAMEMGDWARDLCVMFGTQRVPELDTAYFVGGAFARGLEKEWSKKDE